MRTAAALLLIVTAFLGATISSGASRTEIRSLDGSGNNLDHPTWGQMNTEYIRLSRPNYADGIQRPVTGPPARYVSNRIFNDVGQDLLSENGVSQWGWAWGQFMDHTFGLRDETPAEHAPIPYAAGDPLERFANDFGAIDFFRTPAAPGTGSSSPRQQINTVSSYIDGFNVYGGTAGRLDWLRAGPLDGNPANNSATLLLTADGYLPSAGARGNAVAPPAMDLMGGLVGSPGSAIVAGDVRANENIALTALHTLFAREHNRIVAKLPRRLSEEEKFQIARRVVGAEEQFITYNEFLPAMGVRLSRYDGYKVDVNASLSNEFAVVGYRAHSQIHGDFEPVVAANGYTPAQLESFRKKGIIVGDNGDGTLTLAIPLNVAFGNPTLLPAVGLGPMLKSLGEQQYKNDEQIDDSLRSVLFQVPKTRNSDPSTCSQPIVNPDCFRGVVDLGAIDIQRGRDHGIPSYNDLRRSYGLDPKESFTDITGETTDRFPNDPKIDRRNPIDDPNSLDFTELRDAAGNVIPAGTPGAVVGVRRTTLAARLRAVYGDVDKVDAFVGMVSERHVRGTEMGELQLAMWKKQFEALRDGDRFFYANDPVLRTIAEQYRIDVRQTLAEIVKANTGESLPANVFKVQ